MYVKENMQFLTIWKKKRSGKGVIKSYNIKLELIIIIG